MSTTVITKPETIIETKLLNELKSLVYEESQVVVHCLFQSTLLASSYIRIWPTTFLFDLNSAHQSKLVHVENICMYPDWQLVEPGNRFRFSLIFTGLPRSCGKFDLVEVIPQSGGFEVRNIVRNDTDVYFVQIK